MNVRKPSLKTLLPAVALLLVIITMAWYSSALKAKGGEETAVIIQPGAGTAKIADELKRQGLIKSPTAFKLHARFNELGPEFKSGRYVLNANTSTPEIAQSLTKVSTVANRITIKEGLTQAQIAAQLDKQGLFAEDDFANLKATDFKRDFLQGAPSDAPLEGFLFPETYELPTNNLNPTVVADIQLDQFALEVTTQLRSNLTQQAGSLYSGVIVASLVEEEVRSDADRRLVAGIIYRRLKEDIRLDIDATVRYTLNKPTEALTREDLDSNDPYNTRKLKGLPPTPISNPSLASLEAAANPEASEFLFYLSANDGKTIFAKDLEEHNANVEEFLR